MSKIRGDVIFTQEVMRTFSNVGHLSDSRLFAGFVDPLAPRALDLMPRAARYFKFNNGDLLRVDSTACPQGLAIMAFSESGERSEEALGLTAPTPIDLSGFEYASLAGWLQSKGLHLTEHAKAAFLGDADEAFILRASAPLHIWVLHIRNAEELVTGTGDGAAKLWYQPAQTTSVLPSPLGTVREEFTVKSGTAISYELRAGEAVQIIDVDGQQCSDFQALSLRKLDAELERMIDSTATRSMVRRAYPSPGLFDKFYDEEMRPLLQMLQDTCGRHDTFGLACTARSYEERGFPGHLNCSDNISYALSPYGVAARNAWPAINFFWNTWLDAHHHIMTEEAHSRPGDYVVMRALEDLVCVSTACPDDIDPINGWNPTDVHVRIYKPDTQIQRAVAYRPREDAPMQISQPSPFNERLEQLTDHFAPARDLWTPVSFPSHGTIGEYWACRNAATLQDMSGLRKVDIIGPDAEKLLQLAMTRNIAKLAQYRGVYSLICDETGELIDDGTLFRLEDNIFRWCCGSEESGRSLTALAEQHAMQVRIHDLGSSLPNLALQGPKSRDILSKLIFTQPHVPSLQQLKWFGATIARLHDREGAPFMLTRSGYTGELGYEIFCAEKDALAIWDALMEAGADDGLIPMGSAALDIIRIEAGLAGTAEFAPGADAYEAGLGFAVDLTKADFRGKEALLRNSASPRKVLRGLKFKCDDAPMHGAPIFMGERQVGVVTSSTRSPMFECAIAMARLAVEHADPGTILEVGQLDGRMKRLIAEVVMIPFYDPKRERARA